MHGQNHIKFVSVNFSCAVISFGFLVAWRWNW